jgi:hypothetical protein
MIRPLLELGTAHVRSEFRAHLKNEKTTRSQWQNFVGEWQRYVQLLSGNGQDLSTPTDGRGDLSPNLLDAMNEDQLRRMEKLREELTKS